jgi:methionyl-tRNA synthetase
MERRLITSALPYVNNFPHLGNLIQVLSADVFSRYCRSRGYQTLYICGTDEYGTATETKAKEEGITPKELCDRYYSIHSDIYEWFNIAFDRFGRTSTPNHTEITQDIFLNLDKNGYVKAHTIRQLYCEKCEMFLADRYVRGKCPNCGYEEARGDQCENCGKLLDPTDLIQPRCGTCEETPISKETDHLYIDLPAILPKLQKWMKKASQEGDWAHNAIQMTQAWIRDGLRERGITRDLNWGIPVPKDGFREKVFYVWFDAPIGYISITSNHTEDWKSWWKNPKEVKLYQFIGKDNIPFHTVIFPSSLLGTGEEWTLLHHMSSTEYLNYESGKFSKSKGIGVFGSDARDTGIPVDVWRFYIFYNRPERADAIFTWKDFQEKVNGELIGNLSNLINRTLTFVHKNYDGVLSQDISQDPEEVQKSRNFWRAVKKLEEEITSHLEKVFLRDAFRQIFTLASLGNKRFQDEEPWKVIKEDRKKTARLLSDLVYLIRDLAILINPYIPETSQRIAKTLGLDSMEWDQLGVLSGIDRIGRPKLLFKKLEDEEIGKLRQRFSGSQEDRMKSADEFMDKLDLRVARIEEVERHPRADKLYIETINLGNETRQIVSGLVGYYSEEELIGRNILLVYNLKAAKLRGVKSEGMLLAAERGETVEVVFADDAEPGDRVTLEGSEPSEQPPNKEITIDEFFEIPIKVESFTLKIEGRALTVRGTPIQVVYVENGTVG